MMELFSKPVNILAVIMVVTVVTVVMMVVSSGDGDMLTCILTIRTRTYGE